MVLNITDANFSATLSANYTIAQLFTFLKARFSQCGWGTPIAEQDTTTKIAVYEINFNPLKAMGKVRAVLEITGTAPTFTVRLRLHLFSNYNSGTFTLTANTGANAANGAFFTVSNLVPLTGYAIPIAHEITGVCLVESAVTFKGFLGLCYPVNWESWWNEDTWCRVMLVQPTLCNNFWHCYPNPFNVSSATVVVAKCGLDTFATRNPVDSKVYIVPKQYITSQTWGLSGQFGLEVATSNNSGLITNDISIVSSGFEEWWNMQCADNGIVFRSV